MKDNMMMKIGLWLCALAMFAAYSARAQQHSITELRPIFERLKALKAYSYETVTSAVFPNGQKDQQHTKIYMDRPNKKMSYGSEQQLVVLNEHWLLRADHEHKTVSVFDVSKYDRKNKDVLPQIQSVFQYDMASMFMDSVLSRYGKLLSVETKGGLVTYTIGFKDPTAPLKEMVMVYNNTTSLPETIRFRVENAIGKGKLVRMEIVCRNYTTTVPASIFDEQQYFTIVKGKPVLRQYKNYKVYSVL